MVVLIGMSKTKVSLLYSESWNDEKITGLNARKCRWSFIISENTIKLNSVLSITRSEFKLIASKIRNIK